MSDNKTHSAQPPASPSAPIIATASTMTGSPAIPADAQREELSSTETFEGFPADVQANINLGPKPQPVPLAPRVAPMRTPQITNVVISSPDATAPSAPVTGGLNQAGPSTGTSPGIPNVKPGVITPVSEPEGISLDLPSRYAFYEFKDLYVKPFRVKALAKLHKADEDSSLLHMVEAVSSVLSSTNHGARDLGFKLCLADFYYVLYWLRLHSFTKNTIVHQTTCANPVHLEKVTKQEMPEATLKISRIVSSTDLQVVELEELPDPEKFKLEAPGWYLRPATMRDTLEFSEHPQWLDAEFQYMARLASNVDFQDPSGNAHEPLTLSQKVAAVEEWSPHDASLIAEYEKLLDNFGVNETVTVNCKWCGASRKSKIILDAHSFLSAE